SEMARHLLQLHAYNAAIGLLQQAAETELTDAEVAAISRMSQAELSDESVRANFAANTRDQLAQTLLSLGKNQEAQKWMEAANAIRQEHHMGRNSQFAGRVQGASGAHVVENQIKAEETVEEENPTYWLD